MHDWFSYCMCVWLTHMNPTPFPLDSSLSYFCLSSSAELGQVKIDLELPTWCRSGRLRRGADEGMRTGDWARLREAPARRRRGATRPCCHEQERRSLRWWSCPLDLNFVNGSFFDPFYISSFITFATKLFFWSYDLIVEYMTIFEFHGQSKKRFSIVKKLFAYRDNLNVNFILSGFTTR